MSWNRSMSAQLSPTAIAEENARFMAKVYRWMSLGILLSGFVAYRVGTDEATAQLIVGNRPIFFGLLIAQFAAVFVLIMLVEKMSAMMATAVYLGYAVLSGLTLSGIFVVYDLGMIQNAFFITTLSFMGLSIFGMTTKKDLGPIGTFCGMALFGLIGVGILLMFFPGAAGGGLGLMYNIGGVLIFAGLTAADTQKIKEMNIIGNEETEEDHKEAIYGALTLYLDFINLFLHFLKLMGRPRD